MGAVQIGLIYGIIKSQQSVCIFLSAVVNHW